MGLLLAISRVYIPQFLQKPRLGGLLNATAEAFQVPAPATRGLSYNECLQLFAQFTRDQAEKSVRRGDELDVQSRLLRNAYQIGQQFKEDFNIHRPEEVMQMGAIIYRSLKIDFQGEPRGDIIIKRCFFSTYYSNRVCRLISALDEGLLTGLFGGGKLIFSQRITEGNSCCRAYLEAPGGLK